MSHVLEYVYNPMTNILEMKYVIRNIDGNIIYLISVINLNINKHVVIIDPNEKLIDFKFIQNPSFYICNVKGLEKNGLKSFVVDRNVHSTCFFNVSVVNSVPEPMLQLEQELVHEHVVEQLVNQPDENRVDVQVDEHTVSSEKQDPSAEDINDLLENIRFDTDSDKESIPDFQDEITENGQEIVQEVIAKVSPEIDDSKTSSYSNILKVNAKLNNNEGPKWSSNEQYATQPRFKNQKAKSSSNNDEKSFDLKSFDKLTSDFQKYFIKLIESLNTKESKSVYDLYTELLNKDSISNTGRFIPLLKYSVEYIDDLKNYERKPFFEWAYFYLLNNYPQYKLVVNRFNKDKNNKASRVFIYYTEDGSIDTEYTMHIGNELSRRMSTIFVDGLVKYFSSNPINEPILMENDIVYDILGKTEDVFFRVYYEQLTPNKIYSLLSESKEFYYDIYSKKLYPYSVYEDFKQSFIDYSNEEIEHSKYVSFRKLVTDDAISNWNKLTRMFLNNLCDHDDKMIKFIIESIKDENKKQLFFMIIYDNDLVVHRYDESRKISAK